MQTETLSNMLEIILDSEDPVDRMRPGELLGAALVRALLGLGLDALRSRWMELQVESAPSKPLSALRHRVFLLSAGEVLYPESEQQYAEAERFIAPAVEVAGADPYLFPSMLDVATALALRAGGRAQASPWRSRRLHAPATQDFHSLVQVLLSSGAPHEDSLFQAEGVHLAFVAARHLPATAASALVMALAHLARERGANLLHIIEGGIRALDMEIYGQVPIRPAGNGAHIPTQVTRSDPAWRLNVKENTLQVRLTVTGSGQQLQAAAGWTLSPLVYELPLLLTNIKERRTELRAISGARTRSDVERALGSGGTLQAVAELHAASISPSDQASIARRFEVCAEWIRTYHPQVTCGMGLEFVQV